MESEKQNFNKIKKILCIFLVFVAAGLLFFVPKALQLRETARMMHCMNAQRKLAFFNYHAAYGAFPPAYTVDENGKPLHSWRVLLLPFLEENSLYSQIRLDEPWDSEHNKQFHNQRPNFYACPSGFKKEGSGDTTHTNYLRIVGPDTLTDGPGTVSFDELKYPEITILYVESTRPVCWMAPEDISFSEDLSIRCNTTDPNVGISSAHGKEVLISMVGGDGASIRVFQETPESFIRAAAVKKSK